MDKFIFLDMDGVVNSVEYSTSLRSVKQLFRLDDADPVKIGLIRFICEQTDAKIVISSTWRKGRAVDWFVGYLERMGWPMPPVVGMTPTEKCGKIGRGDQVERWLIDNHYMVPPSPYVILDDDSDFYAWQPLITCNGVYGITLKEVLIAIDVLGLGEKGDAKLISDLQAHVDFKKEM